MFQATFKNICIDKSPIYEIYLFFYCAKKLSVVLKVDVPWDMPYFSSYYIYIIVIIFIYLSV